EFQRKACLDNIKMIEIKLSQGAKPAHGGILPAAKVDANIAKIRGVEIGKDCISPPMHRAFSDPIGLMKFIQQLRQLCGGKPIGFKLCLGKHSEFMGICKAMLETGVTPDFITVDGAEGGTGAAPLEFSNRLGTPIREAIVFVHNCLVGINVRDKIRVIASAKVVTGFDIVDKIALGADMCNVARPMMFAIGCIQALRCNTNTCPTGVTTQDPRRVQALVVKAKCKHVFRFHQATMKSFLDMVGALGVSEPEQLQPQHIFRRIRQDIIENYAQIYHYLQPGELLSRKIPSSYAEDWQNASAARF
ncbi:MAG: FMN-binding glutamate synthase family protein, partial [Gammaproteobacteria bacterium]